MTVKRFRTKIVEINAVQFTGENVEEVLELIPEKRDAAFLYFKLDGADYWDDPEIIANVYDELHATWIGVKKGQWIVRGAKGELYPCDDETFHWKYEEVVPNPFEKVQVRPLSEQVVGLKAGEAIITANEVRRRNGMEEL